LRAAGRTLLAFVVAACGGPEWEIENISVDAHVRRRGVATRLMSEFLGLARQRQVEAILLEVRETNLPARQLYEKWAFAPVGRRRRYYTCPSEDAILYRFDFNGLLIKD